MDSIAVTKPDMGTLSRKRLVLSPFGALSQAFTQELLARAGFEEGHWPFVPLDLLEEGPFDVPSPPAQPIVQVDLSLILQAMRQSEGRTERTVERIVERIIRLREQGSRGATPVQTALRDTSLREAVQPAVQKVQQETIHQAVQSLIQETDHQIAQIQNQGASLQAVQDPKQGGKQGAVQTHELSASVTGSFAHQQHFYSTVTQHIKFIISIRQAGLVQQPDRSPARHTILGGVNRRSLEFFRQLPLLRKARGSSSALSANLRDVILPAQPMAAWFLDTGADLDLPDWHGRASGEHGFARRDRGHMSPDELSHLRNMGDSASFDMADAVIHRSVQRAVRRLGWAHIIRAVHWGSMLKPAASERQIAVLRPLGQKPVEHSTARQTRWLSWYGLEHTTLQDRETTAISPDGLHMARALEYAVQTGRAAEHRSVSDPSMAVRRQPELLLRGDSGAEEEHQWPGIGEEAATTERANRTQASRQKARFDPKGAAAGQGAYLLTSVSRDVRLTGRGFRQFEMEGQEILASPQERLAPAFLLDEELAHKLEKGDLSEHTAAAAGSLGQEVHRPKAIASAASRAGSQDSLPRGSQAGSKPGFQTSSTARAQAIPAAETQTAQSASRQSFPREKAVGRGRNEAEGLFTVLEEPPHRRRQAERNTATPDTAFRIKGPAMYSAQLLTPSVWDVRFTRQEIVGSKAQMNAIAQAGLPDLTLSVPGAAITHRESSEQSGSLVRPDQRNIPADISAFALFAPVGELLYRAGPEQGDTPDSTGRDIAGIQAAAAQKTQTAGPEFRPGALQKQLFAGSAVESMKSVNGRTVQAVPSQSADLKMFHAALPAGVDQRFRERLAGQMKPSFLINPVIWSSQFAGQANAAPGQTGTLSGRTNRPSTIALEPLELDYSSQAQPPDASPAVPAAQGQTTARGLANSDYIRSLPDWARRFLQEGAPQTQEEAVQRMGTVQRPDAGQAMGSARNIAALSFPAGEAFEWTAPDYRAPAPVEYRERPQRQEQSQPRSAYISDAEVQRTADRVYRIIEDRIRRERHRMGL